MNAVSDYGELRASVAYIDPGSICLFSCDSPLSFVSQVQIKGSMVYSNYCVGVEVRARAPVSVISEGTHIFISKATSTSIILSGSQSYDPDNPGAALR